MAFESQSTHLIRACPDIFVRDVVGVGGGDADTKVGKQRGGFRGPGLEFPAVGVVADVAEHEIAEVAVFVGEHVAEAIYFLPLAFPNFTSIVASGMLYLRHR